MAKQAARIDPMAEYLLFLDQPMDKIKEALRDIKTKIKSKSISNQPFKVL